MQCDELEIKITNSAIPALHLSDLDGALHELGMLATCTNSRKEYLSEIREKNICNMFKIHPRFVSNVSLSLPKRTTLSGMRYMPYSLPKREDRLRTKSENNDGEESTSAVRKVVENNSEQHLQFIQLKKAKSLENIVTEVEDEFVPEVEVVSDCIEKLKVVE